VYKTPFGFSHPVGGQTTGRWGIMGKDPKYTPMPDSTETKRKTRAHKNTNTALWAQVTYLARM
jgi:hypothetical protein